MQRKRPSQIGATREERVRTLGFDPAHLTPEEQVELLELCSAGPDQPLKRGAAVQQPRWSTAPLA